MTRLTQILQSDRLTALLDDKRRQIQEFGIKLGNKAVFFHQKAILLPNFFCDKFEKLT